MYKTISTIAASIAICAAMSATASAKDIAFAYKPHELQSVAGATAVYNRLENRVERACRSQSRSPVWGKQNRSECADRLTNEIVAAIDNARLSQAHARAKKQTRYASR